MNNPGRNVWTTLNCKLRTLCVFLKTTQFLHDTMTQNASGWDSSLLM